MKIKRNMVIFDKPVKEVHFTTDEGTFVVDEVSVDSLNRAYIKLVIFRDEQNE